MDNNQANGEPATPALDVAKYGDGDADAQRQHGHGQDQVEDQGATGKLRFHASRLSRGIGGLVDPWSDFAGTPEGLRSRSRSRVGWPGLNGPRVNFRTCHGMHS